MKVEKRTLFEYKQQNDFLNKLNEVQRIAVESPIKQQLVLAGPGTGKTTVITFKTIFLLLNNNINPEKLLILTFTNKAADEMIRRIKQYTNQKIPYIGTFHSVIIKILRENLPIRTSQYSINDKINIVDEEEKIEIIKNILSKNKNKKKHNPYMISNIISSIKNGIPVKVKNDEIEEIIFEYNHFLKKINSLDFDDIILCMNNLLTENKKTKEKISSKFDYVIIDEFQDINKTQFEFVYHITGGEKAIFAVGDDDQSIYRFRNSDVEIMLNFKKYYPESELIILKYNYRSGSKIIKTCSQLISFNINRFEKNILPFYSKNDEVEIRIFKDEENELDYIAQKINENKEKHIAVLCRTNDVGKETEKNLIKRGINAKFVGSYDFFERKEVKDIIAFLKVINNPKDDLNLIRILKNYFKLKKSELNKIIAKMEEKNVIDVLEEENFEIYTKINELIKKQNKNVDTVLEKIIELTEKNEINETFLSFVNNFCKNNEKNDVESFLNYITLIRMNNEQKVEKKNKVWIMTMHSSKGLEFEVVFVCRVKQGVIPHFKTSDDEKEEERRLLYVALSRAKEKLYITTPVPPSEFIIPLLN